jgi:hypothetical protein
LARKFVRVFNESPDEFESEEKKEGIRNWMIEEFGSLEMDNFLEMFAKRLDPLQNKAKQMEDEIYEKNQPVTNSYEIIKKW